MICMRNVRIFRIKRGRFLKFSKTKENCLASNKYIPKNYLFPPSNSNLSSNIDESKIEKKKEKNLEKRLLESFFSNSRTSRCLV